MTKDEKYISRCLQLAYNGLCNTAPNPMVGAVIVYHDTIIGEGYHIRCGESFVFPYEGFLVLPKSQQSSAS